MRIALTLHFAKGYIAHPYWPARERLINLTKEAGVNRARSQAKREQALKAILDAKGMTRADYDALEADANRPFYTRPDGEILVPAHQLHGMMAQASEVAPSSVRIAKTDQVRTILEFQDLRTGRMKADGVWDRFVAPKSGPGQKLSNQRALRSDPYLEEFDAVGELRLVTDDLHDKAKRFIEWAGREVGVGASRKMGWGRFTVEAWEKA